MQHHLLQAAPEYSDLFIEYLHISFSAYTDFTGFHKCEIKYGFNGRILQGIQDKRNVALFIYLAIVNLSPFAFNCRTALNSQPKQGSKEGFTIRQTYHAQNPKPKNT